jgi:hypothetical protein
VVVILNTGLDRFENYILRWRPKESEQRADGT